MSKDCNRGQIRYVAACRTEGLQSSWGFVGCHYSRCNGERLFRAESRWHGVCNTAFAMKLIIAYIQPERLNAVKQALYEREVYKMSVSNALGCGQQKGYLHQYRGAIETDIL